MVNVTGLASSTHDHFWSKVLHVLVAMFEKILAVKHKLGLSIWTAIVGAD
jgi:hypothetical protein